MGAAQTVSITLPPELLSQVQAMAEREQRTISEFVGDLLRDYVTQSSEPVLEDWDTCLAGVRARAKEMSITTEEDVDRLIHEYRREKREQAV